MKPRSIKEAREWVGKTTKSIVSPLRRCGNASLNLVDKADREIRKDASFAEDVYSDTIGGVRVCK